MYKAPEVPSYKIHTIRPYLSEDEQAVYNVCLKTCLDGSDGTEIFSEYPNLAPERYGLSIVIQCVVMLVLAFRRSGLRCCRNWRTSSRGNWKHSKVSKFRCAANKITSPVLLDQRQRRKMNHCVFSVFRGGSSMTCPKDLICHLVVYKKVHFVVRPRNYANTGVELRIQLISSDRKSISI